MKLNLKVSLGLIDQITDLSIVYLQEKVKKSNLGNSRSKISQNRILHMGLAKAPQEKNNGTDSSLLFLQTSSFPA